MIWILLFAFAGVYLKDRDPYGVAWFLTLTAVVYVFTA